MSSIVLMLVVAIPVALVAWHWGGAAAPRDPQPLRIVLGLEEPDQAMYGPLRNRVAALQDALVEAGWVHKDHVRDPEHYDEAGRYRWWGV